MRILITADLHYRPAQRAAYLAFAGWVQAQQPDCLVVAGDVGHPLRLFNRALQLFAGLDCPKLLVAGNHDLYRGEFGSRTLWEQALPLATRAEGFVWLEDEVVLLPADTGQRSALPAPGEGREPAGQIAIAGTIGWYDYSSHAAHMTGDRAVLQAAKQAVSHDADYIDWPWGDVAMARYLAKGFAARLEHAAADPSVSRIVVVTHIPIFAEALPEYPESDFWSLMRAYMGNLTLGELVRRTPKVTHVVSGHVHRGGRWTVAGAYGPIDFRVVGSQPSAPRAVVLDL